jgi:hypothetical protein
MRWYYYQRLVTTNLGSRERIYLVQGRLGGGWLTLRVNDSLIYVNANGGKNNENRALYICKIYVYAEKYVVLYGTAGKEANDVMFGTQGKPSCFLVSRVGHLHKI